jgi:hypothetical protein
MRCRAAGDDNDDDHNYTGDGDHWSSQDGRARSFGNGGAAAGSG